MPVRWHTTSKQAVRLFPTRLPEMNNLSLYSFPALKNCMCLWYEIPAKRAGVGENLPRLGFEESEEFDLFRSGERH